jgi:hypothetical protein
LRDRIDEALARPPLPSAVETPKTSVSSSNRTRSSGGTIIPYDISAVDRQTDLLHTKDKQTQDQVMLYTGIGLACVFVASVLTIGYLVYRRRRAVKVCSAHSSSVKYVAIQQANTSDMDRTKFLNGGAPATNNSSAAFKANYLLPTTVTNTNQLAGFANNHVSLAPLLRSFLAFSILSFYMSALSMLVCAFRLLLVCRLRSAAFVYIRRNSIRHQTPRLRRCPGTWHTESTVVQARVLWHTATPINTTSTRMSPRR